MQEENKKVKSIDEREKDIIAFWKKHNIFEKSLKKDSPMGEYVFYDGPPTANGRPGIHHLEARAFKDAIPRYKTMQGYNVRRKAGWDTHGLPVELEVEKQLGITSKKQIEEYGIDKFNSECKKSVWKYIDEWEKFTDRSAYWIDLKNPYVTYHSSYIESIWNVMGEVEKKGLLYKDYRIVPWCSRCGTALSSHELAQGYEDVKDWSIYAMFKIKSSNLYKVSNSQGGTISEPYFKSGESILAWTTTPWTLPGNVALAVNPTIPYVKVQITGVLGDYSGHNLNLSGEVIYLAKSRLEILNPNVFKYKILEELKGSDLVGLEYEPLYPYLKEQIGLYPVPKESLDMAFKVYPADFVTAENGTGVVHTAVMYGQDDFELGTKFNLPKVHLVTPSGNFLSGSMDFLSGRFVKDEDVAVDIIKDLAHRGLLFKKEKYEHSYPHCWRCKTPLIYYARDSWYIRMSQLRDNLVKNNQQINWEPEHIKNGRFGEWLSEVKDWAISRERYWGTPLPIWESEDGTRHIFTSREDLMSHTAKSDNTYHMLRHGQCSANVEGICSYASGYEVNLTDLGKEEVRNAAEELRGKNIDLIYTSPFLRTKESAKIIADALNLPHVNIIEDERLVDLNAGIFEGKTWKEYFKFFEDKDRFNEPVPGGESVLDVKRRVGEFIYEINKNLKGKNVLIVAHGVTLWMLESIAKGATEEEMKLIREKLSHAEHHDSLKNGGWLRFDFTPLPHNRDYELDLHRPYIDEYPIFDEDGNMLTRTKEVMDVWFDSGAMPFAQDGYPRLTDKVYFPADYICEAIDQTRGWFYTLHAVGALLERGNAYKNVICLGHILDKEGQKMSKSKGNVVNPWEMFEKYGADALRFWMYSVNQPGDSKNFDERTVDDIVKKVFNLVRNVYAFYDLYRDKEEEKVYNIARSKNPLDLWILAKQSDLIDTITKSLDEYSLFVPCRAIRDFVDDLSTWYVRRSRERLRMGDTEALETLYLVLKSLSKLMAPFTPFIAEELWQDLKNKNDEESVHLTTWPEILDVSNKEEIYEKMIIVREICTVGNSVRKQLGIPVRQPLQTIIVTDSAFSKIHDEKVLLDIVKDELNIKNVVFDNSVEVGNKSIAFDTNITPELKDEGNFRELVRFVQDTRKKMSLNAGQTVELYIKTDSVGEEFIKRWEKNLLEEVSAKEVMFENIEGESVKIEDMNFSVVIKVV